MRFSLSLTQQQTGGPGDGYISILNNSNDAGGTGGTSYFNEDRVRLIAYSSKELVNEDYRFATKPFVLKATGDQRMAGESNLEQYNGFVVIYEQIDYCCQETYHCVVVNSDDLENADVLCVCSSNSFQPKACASIGKCVLYAKLYTLSVLHTYRVVNYLEEKV